MSYSALRRHKPRKPAVTFDSVDYDSASSRWTAFANYGGLCQQVTITRVKKYFLVEIDDEFDLVSNWAKGLRVTPTWNMIEANIRRSVEAMITHAYRFVDYPDLLPATLDDPEPSRLRQRLDFAASGFPTAG